MTNLLEKKVEVLKKGDVFRDFPKGPEMVVIPSGSFMMGSAADEPYRYEFEGPQHRVTIGYRLAVGKYPVTFAQWNACVTDGGTQYRPKDNGWGRGRRPVINVSWDDAQQYIAWLNHKLGLAEDDPYRYRLLSEAEWEYACRAGTTTAFNTPNGLLSPDDATYNASENCCAEISPIIGRKHEKTTQVGSYAPNAWGLYDMHGNVWEWVQDCYKASYKKASARGRAWESNTKDRVLRGGAWDLIPANVRSAFRIRYFKTGRYHNDGFRLARTLPPVTTN